MNVTMARLWLIGAALSLSGGAQADSPFKFAATLSGAQEVGEVRTRATGTIEAEFDEALSKVAVRLQVRRLPSGVGITGAHFHCSLPGANGPIALGMFEPGPLQPDRRNRIRGSLNGADFLAGDPCLDSVGRPVNNIAALAFAMRDGLIYVNVHTRANPSGEIRGQMIVKDDNSDSDGRKSLE